MDVQPKGPDNGELHTSRTWHEMYIEMLACPTERVKSDKAFAEENGLHPSSIVQWKAANRIGIYNEVQRRRRKYINELRAAAIRSVTEKMAVSKGVEAETLILKMTGDLVERTENTNYELSYEDKLRRIEALKQKAIKQGAVWTGERTGESGQ